MGDISKFIPAEFVDTVVEWNGSGSGVLNSPPLLWKACKSGVYGNRFDYPGGSVYQSLFMYLNGVPDRFFFENNPDLFFGTYLVCMSDEWEKFILGLPNEKFRMSRWLMSSPEQTFVFPEPPSLGGEYKLGLFDDSAYYAHPFGHAANYEDYSSFEANGVGAVVRLGDEIVASASSFISFERMAEIDISTLPQHRRRGLAEACLGLLLEQCKSKAIEPHWDAQNFPSRKLAEKYGFNVFREYAVTVLAPL